MEIGDIKRLEHIKETFENKKIIYTSDRKYVESLASQYFTVEQKPKSVMNSFLQNSRNQKTRFYEEHKIGPSMSKVDLAQPENSDDKTKNLSVCGKCGSLIPLSNDYCGKCGMLKVIVSTSPKIDDSTHKSESAVPMKTPFIKPIHNFKPPKLKMSTKMKVGIAVGITVIAILLIGTIMIFGLGISIVK